MIIGTAGHIDHGKTTLVKALTGTDTDRLPEEKKRGISIELGYAFVDVPDNTSDAAPRPSTRLAFIDVPGHERLVHTMVSGASAIDLALLLVAADDGPMPQTLEHLAVLRLLHVPRCAVVITKTDRATPEQVKAVRTRMQALMAQPTAATPAASATLAALAAQAVSAPPPACPALPDAPAPPIFAVSARTGEGLAALQTYLAEQAMHASRPPLPDAHAAQAAWRLAIDRVFTVQGTGTIVTGSIHAGHVQVGDTVALPHASGRTRLARVRSLHAQNQPVHTAHSGQRCAVALAGLATTDIARGQWLVQPDIALTTSRIDTAITLWHHAPAPLHSGQRVQVHIGTAHTTASVALLDTDTLPPAASALVQLVLHQPVSAWHGTRILLRNDAGNTTLAGGVVLDPFAPTRYRRTPQRLQELAALQLPSPQQRLHALVNCAAHGVHTAQYARAQGVTTLPPLPADSLHISDWALGAAALAQHTAAVLAALQQFHQQHPDELGPDAARLRRLAAPRLPSPLWDALLHQLCAQDACRIHGACVHLPTHAVQLSATEARLAEHIQPLLARNGHQGTWARDLARYSGDSEALVRTTLARLARRGELHQIVKDLFYDTATMQHLAALVRHIAQAHGGEVQAHQFRDAAALGRKRAIQILEFFDRAGLTRRVADTHILRAESTLFMGDTPPH